MRRSYATTTERQWCRCVRKMAAGHRMEDLWKIVGRTEEMNGEIHHAPRKYNE